LPRFVENAGQPLGKIITVPKSGLHDDRASCIHVAARNTKGYGCSAFPERTGICDLLGEFDLDFAVAVDESPSPSHRTRQHLAIM